MKLKRILKIFFISIIIILITFFIYKKFFKPKEIIKQKIEKDLNEENLTQSNIIKDVNYTTKDADGNEYIITASQAEIDYSNTNILFLTDVNALIKLVNSENITITSDFGKYNIKNFDTIFSKNVIITYLDHKITGEYLDFSMKKNLMVISRNIIYTSLENILKADVLEMNIQTKDTIIYMYEEDKKINVNSKD